VRLFSRAVFTCTLRVLPFLVLPSIVLASGGEEGGWRSIWDLGWRIANFAILAGVLFYYARKPAVNAIRNSIESGKNHMKEAK
jgi:hypothetical protein